MVKYLIIYINDIIFLDSTELNAPHIFENDDIDGKPNKQENDHLKLF